MQELHNNQEQIQILKKVSLLADIKENNEALQLLSGVMTHKKFLKSHVLIQQSTEGHQFYILTKGVVSIYKNTPDGDKYKVVVLKADNYPAFGEGALMEGEVRSATIICDSDIECLILERSAFEQFCKTYPQFALPVFKRVALSIMVRLNQTSHDLMLLHKALMEEIRAS